MKKMFITLAMLASLSVVFAEPYNEAYGKKEDTTNYEMVNDHTMIFHNVERIEIKQPDSCKTQIVNWDNKQLITIKQGNFSVTVPNGNYLVQSKIPFTHTETRDVYYIY